LISTSGVGPADRGSSGRRQRRLAAIVAGDADVCGKAPSCYHDGIGARTWS
jgi:hypothetical protein